MSKLRSVNTHFWSDTYVIELDPIEKLLFLYLITNEATNMLGIYELHIRRISFDTGIDKDMVKKIFGRFEESGKAKYLSGYVILQNFTKHQSYNTNMETSAINSWNELPLEVRKDRFCKPILKALKGFSKSSEPIAEIEVELESELEDEVETEHERKYSISTVDFWDGNQPIDYESFVDYFNKVTGGQCRMTDNKRPDIRKQLNNFAGVEIKKALFNRSKALKDSEYLTSWESIFTRKVERMEKYLTMKTENLSNGKENRAERYWRIGEELFEDD